MRLGGKIWSVLLFAIILLTAASGFCAAGQYPEGGRYYTGAINGNLDIHMFLDKQGGKMQGWYYYDWQSIKLALSGDVTESGFYLKEYDENGANTGVFSGTFGENGKMQGYWYSPDLTTRLPFSLNPVPYYGIGKIVKVYYSLPVTTFEVALTATDRYLVSVGGRDKKAYGIPLKIYKDEKAVFETLLRGDGGEICLTGARGGGKADLVVILGGGSGGYLNDFWIIGERNGSIGVLADKSLLDMGYTWPEVSDYTDKVGIEFHPAGAWPKYRVDVIWKQDAGKYVSSTPIRITPPVPVPAADKTVFFSLKPEYSQVIYFAGSTVINSVRIKTGEKLLLRRDPGMNQELGLSYWGSYDPAVIKPEFVGGDFLITAKNPG